MAERPEGPEGGQMTSVLMSSCLVTGCAGNVGSNLAKALLDKGLSVVGVDNYFSGMPSNMADFRDNPAFTFYERSITDTLFLAWLFKKYAPFAAVFHLAAIISVPYSMDHAEETMAVNHEASLALHDQARQSGCGAFVFAGSAAEYGKPLERPAREQDAGDPMSPYGVSKHLMSLAIDTSGYGCSLRFFNLYGPTRAKPGPYDGVVRIFLDKVRQGHAPVILGDGKQTRDFVFLGDALHALQIAAGLGPSAPLTGIYNVGTGQGTSIAELADMAMQLAVIGGQPKYGAERPGDILFSVADNAKLRQATGWVSSTTLRDGLAMTMEGMKSISEMPVG